jgi:hypothetical protein
MAKKKESVPNLVLTDLVVGQVYRGKRPKIYGLFERLVDDRQILHMSQHKCPCGFIDHGYTPEFEEWCKKPGMYRHTFSESDQLTYELETGKNAKNIETVWDIMVQYDSPSVKDGKNFPSIPASKFLKWAASNVTSIMPKGEWASTI